MGDVTNYCYFGTPLPPLEKPDGVPAKRHQNPEDQIVTDENGRRRFHGAFTGGFSAGYWNTVGSQEGWTPQSFKSSRSEKAPQRQQQRPEDFMDAEDLGEFGIAPKKVQVRPEFAGDNNVNEGESKERKRKLQQPNIGPIPGQPVLSQLLKSVDVESVAVRILKHWGWKPGRGVGPRQTRKEKKQAQERNKREMYVLERYGCDVNTQSRKPIGYDDSDNDMASSSSSHGDESEDDGITYAPEDFEPRPAIKENRYGLGYTPLSRDPVLAQDIVAQPTRMPQVFEVVDKNNMRFSITGQAFGVGALEDDDDEEVYHREDWTKYDFSLQDERQKEKQKQQRTTHDNSVLEGFVVPKKDSIYKPIIYKVTVPPDFRPRNWAERRSRFEPLDPHRQKNLRIEKDFKQFSLRQQSAITPEQRGQLLGEEAKLPTEVATTSAHAQKEVQRQNDEKAKALLERITKNSNFTKGGIITADGVEKPSVESFDVALMKERENLLEKAHNKTKGLATDMLSGSFKPFVTDEAKQKRYDEFLKANLKTEEEISDFLRNIQPFHLSEWDREMEKKEFIQARNIYKPLGGIMSDRFVTETAVEAEKVQQESAKEVEKKIIMQRTSSMWKPNALLCKRYNIAEPYGGALPEEKKPNKAKLSIFDYLETSVNKKSDFQTPVIIPKHIEKPMAIVKQTPTRPLPIEPTATESIPMLTDDTTIALPTTTAAVISEVPTKSSERAAQTKGFVARTDLQKRVVESIEKPAVEKLELFKAIFDDSDDDEEDGSNANKDNGEEEKSVESQPPSIRQPLSAAAANLLRNTSPPRGLFAALFKDSPIPTPPPSTTQSTIAAPTPTPTPPNNATKEDQPKIAFKPRNERLPKEPDDDIADVYGPKLPERPAQTNDIEGKILQLLQKHKEQAVVNQRTNDEWIERKLEKSGSGSEDETSDSESDSRSSISSASSDKHKRALKKKKSAKKLKKHKSKDRHKKHVKKEKKHKSKKTTHKNKKAKKSSK